MYIFSCMWTCMYASAYVLYEHTSKVIQYWSGVFLHPSSPMYWVRVCHLNWTFTDLASLRVYIASKIYWLSYSGLPLHVGFYSYPPLTSHGYWVPDTKFSWCPSTTLATGSTHEPLALVYVKCPSLSQRHTSGTFCWPFMYPKTQSEKSLHS